MIQAVLTGHSLVSPKGQIYGKRLALLPGNYSVVMPTLNPNDNNSVLNVVFQVNTHNYNHTDKMVVYMYM